MLHRHRLLHGALKAHQTDLTCLLLHPELRLESMK